MNIIVSKDSKGIILTLTERILRHLICRYLPHGKITKYVNKAVIEKK